MHIFEFGQIRGNLILHAMRIDRDCIFGTERQQDEGKVARVDRNSVGQSTAEDGYVLIRIAAEVVKVCPAIEVPPADCRPKTLIPVLSS